MAGGYPFPEGPVAVPLCHPYAVRQSGRYGLTSKARAYGVELGRARRKQNLMFVKPELISGGIRSSYRQIKRPADYSESQDDNGNLRHCQRLALPYVDSVS